MVSKEAAIVIGPILHQMARRQGLIYTEVEGDQPGLLIGLISWARTLGLKIRVAGKASEYDFVLAEDDTLVWKGRRFPGSGLKSLWRETARVGRYLRIPGGRPRLNAVCSFVPYPITVKWDLWQMLRGSFPTVRNCTLPFYVRSN